METDDELTSTIVAFQRLSQDSLATATGLLPVHY